jgi:hypothetical protein
MVEINDRTFGPPAAPYMDIASELTLSTRS